MMKRKIFFSYSRIDAAEFALKLACDLRDADIEIWIDQLDIKAGETWDLAIESALKNTDAILFVVSDKSIVSRNVLDEVYYALDENKLVIPVITNNVILPFRIRRLQHIDFTNGYDNAFQKLLKTVNGSDIVQNYPIAALSPANSKKFSRWKLGVIALAILLICVTGIFIYSNSKATIGRPATPVHTPQSKSLIINRAAQFSLAKNLIDNHKLLQATIILDSIISNLSNCSADSSGCLYENGITAFNEERFDYAFAWFCKAATKSNAKSMCMIGNMFYSGEWVKADLSQALDWYRKAEAYNNTVAILMLGIFYLEGKVVTRDLLVARHYFQRVIKNNDDADAKKLATRKLLSIKTINL